MDQRQLFIISIQYEHGACLQVLDFHKAGTSAANT